jgi:outer membrane protein assembly factor BamD
MIKLRLYIIGIITGLCLLFSACDNLEKIRKSSDFDYKYTKANEYYDKKKYAEANVLYEELLPVFKGTKKLEEMYPKYAYSFFYLKNYIIASYHFKNFTDIFPNNTLKDEFEYLSCLCLYYESPEPSLEQSNTVKAIAALQTFVNTHPESPKVAEANRIIDEARKKIELKDFESAELYYNIGQYKGATTTFASLLKKYPDSDKADYYQYMIIKSNYEYAKNSVPEKQEERYNQCLVDYNDFISNYPNSKLKDEADKLKIIIFANLEKIKSNVRR